MQAAIEAPQRRYGKTAEAKLLIWTAMRVLREFEAPQLIQKLELGDRTVYDYVQALLNAGYLSVLAEYAPKGERGNCARYRLESDTGLYPPRPVKGVVRDPNLHPEFRDKRERLWQAIRQLRVMDSAQLATLTGQNQGAISRYLKFLSDEGYLAILSGNASGKAGSWITYRLVRETGPLAPMKRRDGTLYDPNLDLKDIKRRLLK
ncbi:MAG: hypothetical protein AAF609_05615 [Cyanobacteria bacterium P01_C01_bin.120]